MADYASGTAVPAERSRAELEKLLRRFGASQFAYGWDEESGSEHIAFSVVGRKVSMTLPLPNRDDPRVRLTPSGRTRTPAQIQDAWTAETRRRWRSLVLVVKAKLTAVTDGISTVEREFLADLVMPDGQTFVQWAGKHLPANVKPELER